MSPTEESIDTMFRFLDVCGTAQVTAAAELELAGGDHLAVYAGGPGIKAGPVPGPFAVYEVMIDHDLPRFWSPYTNQDDPAGSLYAFVPKLLLTHHIVRRGGIEQMTLDTHVKPAIGTFSMTLSIPTELQDRVLDAIRGVSGATVVTSSFIAR